MKKEYIQAIEKQYSKNIKNMLEWEDRHIDSKVFPFYEKVLFYVFYNEPNRNVEHYNGSVQLSVYSLLENVCGSIDDFSNFVLSFQSFLSNAIMDDSYFKIEWTKMWVNPDDGFDFDISKRMPCDKNDEYGEPAVKYSYDGEEGYSKDIKLLEEALDIMIEREKARYNLTDDWYKSQF